MADTHDCDKYDWLDILMMNTIDQRQTHSTLIVCFFTGEELPPYCASMLRVPAPKIGAKVTDCLHSQIDAAIEMNSAIHDGAVIVGRNQISEDYFIRGWSYRLFPPCEQGFQEANRGSAFNSGLAMSMVTDIDAIYLSSNHGFSKFVRGNHTLLR